MYDPHQRFLHSVVIYDKHLIYEKNVIYAVGRQGGLNEIAGRGARR